MKEEHAFMSESLPCNPIPFLNRMIEIIKEKGTGAVTNPRYVSCLHILTMLTHGNMYNIDSYEIHQRLSKIFTEELQEV